MYPRLRAKLGCRAAGDIPASPAVDTEAMVVQDCALCAEKRVNGGSQEVKELEVLSLWSACVRVM